MQKFIASVTHKGQITLPKKLRQQFGIASYGKVLIVMDDIGARIEPTQDITHLAGTFIPEKMKPILEAREKMEETYHRS